MFYDPFKKITYQSPLTASEIKTRLMENVEPLMINEMGIKTDYPKPYGGLLFETRFEIMRNINYNTYNKNNRNSFLPVIVGSVQQSSDGCVVVVELRLHKMVRLLLKIFYGFAAFFLLSVSYASIRDQEFTATIFVPVIIAMFTYFLSALSFASEVDKAKEDLGNWLNATTR